MSSPLTRAARALATVLALAFSLPLLTGAAASAAGLTHHAGVSAQRPQGITPINSAANGAVNQTVFRPVYPASGNATSVTETGWGHVQYPSDGGIPEPGRLQFVPAPGAPTDPFRPSADVAQFTLEPFAEGAGDVTDTGGDLANRVELYDRLPAPGTPPAAWPDPVGSTRWYSFSIYVPASFAFGNPSNWFDFVQWKGLNSGSPALAMEISRNNFMLGGVYGDQYLGHVSPGSWTHFVVGIHFSDSAGTGWVTVYRDNELLVGRVATQTMNDAVVNGVDGVDPSYLKMGIYRSTTWNTTATIDLTAMNEATSLASVS